MTDPYRHVVSRGRVPWGDRPLPPKQEHNHLVKMRSIIMPKGVRVVRVLHANDCPYLGWDITCDGQRHRMASWCTCDPEIVMSDGTRC